MISGIKSVSNGAQNNTYRPAFGAKIFRKQNAIDIFNKMGEGVDTWMTKFTPYSDKINCSGLPVNIILDSKMNLLGRHELLIQSQLRKFPQAQYETNIEIPDSLLGNKKLSANSEIVKNFVTRLQLLMNWAAKSIKDTPEFLIAKNANRFSGSKRQQSKVIELIQRQKVVCN